MSFYDKCAPKLAALRSQNVSRFGTLDSQEIVEPQYQHKTQPWTFTEFGFDSAVAKNVAIWSTIGIAAGIAAKMAGASLLVAGTVGLGAVVGVSYLVKENLV